MPAMNATMSWLQIGCLVKSPVDTDDDQRRDRPHYRQPDSLRQMEEAPIQEAERRREHDQDRRRIETG